MSLSFGTDGVRGQANTELSPELALALGRAAARVLGAGRFVIGRDTRRSGRLIESALAAGLASEGCDVELLGVLPTPAVAWACAAEGVSGAMISASHNPFDDNGVKFFGVGGHKLSDAMEQDFEIQLSEMRNNGVGADVPVGSSVGAIVDRSDVSRRYGEAVVVTLEHRSLDGLFVLLDCAHGAASEVAPSILRSLGASVEVIGADPDGCNINDGYGSTHPEQLQEAVLSRKADVGLALDGDADRLIAVDHLGRLIDGDQLLAVCAIDMANRKILKHDTVVVTVMTNLGFRLAMQDRGIAVCETQVGDRYVLEALKAGGYSLGGEQSGHLIFADLASTGDGTLSSVQVLDVMARTGRSLSELVDDAMTQLPQVLHNVSVANRRLDVADALADEIAAIEEYLNDNGEHGRVLVRPSGTEPLVRVMAEASTISAAEAAVERLARAVQRVCS